MKLEGPHYRADIQLIGLPCCTYRAVSLQDCIEWARGFARAHADLGRARAGSVTVSPVGHVAPSHRFIVRERTEPRSTPARIVQAVQERKPLKSVEKTRSVEDWFSRA